MAQFRDGISFWLILSLALVFLGLTTLYAMRRQVAGRANMQLHASQSEWDKMRRECDKMRRESKKKDDELVWLRRQGKEMLDEAKTMREELVRVQGMVQKTQKRTQELEAELENIQGEKKAQARQLHLQSLDLKASEDESRVLKVQHGQALELLKSRTSELIGAEAFLTKADSLSGSDVLDMVTGLNMEASQTAAFMADSFEFRKRGEIIDDSADVIVACRHASEVIGERMVHLLRSTEHAEDPMLIQIALQSAMLCVSEWIIDAWCFQDEYRNIFLHEVYRTVQESEDQAVAGRWRALTRRHVRRMVPEEHPVPKPILFHFVRSCVNILAASGCKQTLPQIHHMIMTKFVERLTVVSALALRINKATWEDVTSREMEVAYRDPTTIFNSSTMDDAFGRTGGGMTISEEPILCTTDLGMVCVIKENGKPRRKEIILLKPRILLESTIKN